MSGLGVEVSLDGPEAGQNLSIVSPGSLSAELAMGWAAWSAEAACRGTGTTVFFVPSARAEARSLCAHCAVAEPCLWWAMAVEEQTGYRFGIWGGTTPALRARIAAVAGPDYARRRLRLALAGRADAGTDEHASGGEAA